MAKKMNLKKAVKKLNKLDLVDEIDLDQDDDDLQEDFIAAIEEIDDEGDTAKVDDEILDFYEDLIPDEKDKDNDDDDDDDKEEKKKKKKEKAKDKKKKKEKAIDLDAIEEEIEDMDFDELEEYAGEHDIEFDYEEDEDDEDDIRKDIMKYWKKKAKAAKKGKGKKDKGKTKNKKEKKKKGKPIQQHVVDALKKSKGKKIQVAKVAEQVIKARDKEGASGADGIIKQYVRVIIYALLELGFATGDEDAIKLKK